MLPEPASTPHSNTRSITFRVPTGAHLGRPIRAVGVGTQISQIPEEHGMRPGADELWIRAVLLYHQGCPGAWTVEGSTGLVEPQVSAVERLTCASSTTGEGSGW